MKTKKNSQCGRILAHLLKNQGRFVPMPELARIASPTKKGFGLAVATRISNLRERGHVIDCSIKRFAGQPHSSYKLVSSPVTEI